MDLYIVSYFGVFINLICSASSMTNCDIRDIDVNNNCVYTVVCDQHAGSAWLTECNYEPYVTFIVTNSNVAILTTGFFGSTNFDARVRAFKAITNLWLQIESYAFRYYPKCIVMDLSYNNIRNIKDSAFKHLIALQRLNLSGNAIDTIHPRSFIISDARTSELEMLDVSFNLLTELSGDMFSYVPKLKQLYLNNNKIITFGDDLFAHTKFLTHLFLQNNSLTSLNMTLINLKSLNEINISFNKITKLLSYELNSLVALEYVNMSHNFIETIESNCFNRAFNLQSLDLKYNKIETTVDNAMFINNNKLKYLDLGYNNITHVKDNAFKNTILNFLSLQKNNMSGDITESTFAGLQNVTSFDLSNQSITNIRSKAFAGTLNLICLNLSQNLIINVDITGFLGSDSLNILDLSHNYLSNIYFLNISLTNLRDLYLNNNKLVSIPEHVFQQTVLKKLDISNNNITNIEQHSLPLSNLQYLNVSNNPLMGILKSGVFSPAKFLRYLDLSNLNFSIIDKMAFVDLPVLARLNISHNELQYIDPFNFKGMENMYSLDVSHNQLPTFHIEQSALENVKALYLNNNRLASISEMLMNMSSLFYIDISYNDISELNDVDFSLLPNLKVLHLSRNKIKHFNNPRTNSLSKLTDLNLASNQIAKIDLSFYEELVVANLCNNSISNINSSFFENLNNLQFLDISKNNITEIIPGTFQKLNNLRLLNLSHNYLSTLRYGIFKGLGKTEVLDLSYNDIEFIDVDILHETTDLVRLTIDYNHIKTVDVEKLFVVVAKIATLSLGGNPISCKEIVHNIRNLNSTFRYRNMEVTSIDKIYHEDNVHGIRCGDVKVTTTTVKSSKNVSEPETQLTNHLVVGCYILILLLVMGIVAYFYFYRRSHIFTANRESRLQSSTSLYLSGSELRSDLLD